MTQQFTNDPIDLDQLPKYETVIFTRPHPDYWKVISINLVIWLFLLAACLVTLFIIETQISAQMFLVGGAYILFAVMLFIIYQASFKRRGYALREKDIIYKSGIIAETTTIVPLHRIQHVTLNEGLLSRMFKLGTLKVYTAGGQSGHLGIAGIEIEKARSMKEMLLKRLDQIDIINTPGS